MPIPLGSQCLCSSGPPCLSGWGAYPQLPAWGQPGSPLTWGALLSTWVPGQPFGHPLLPKLGLG